MTKNDAAISNNSKQLIVISFALSIFLGSFLLFQIQPIIGKYILPWFGGTSAVWTTALLFFQLMLLLGYFYVFLISRFSIKKQVLLHSGILVGISCLFLYLFSISRDPVLPDLSWKLADTYSPIIQVLSLLTISIGLPYFILSTTSILLQKWYSLARPGKSPYIFYALSNTASLLAIISYPILIEPLLQLQTQGVWWSIGFIFYSIVLLLSCVLTSFSPALHKNTSNIEKNTHIVQNQKRIYGIWLLLPALSSIMLLSITNLLTQSVAPIPFLWLLPLCLYLLSFIFCFSGSKLYLRNTFAYIFLLSTPFVLIFTFIGAPSAWLGIFVYSLALFCSCMLCHGEAYSVRPDPKHLDLFYLLIALGSAAGALFVSIIAPLLFKGLWEIYIGFYIGFILAVFVLIHYQNSFIYRHIFRFFSTVKEIYLVTAILFPFVIGSFYFIFLLVINNSSVNIWRNFYGVLRVETRTINNEPVSYFTHGRIIHGLQIQSDPQRFEPTSYYHKKSGIGLALLNYPKAKKGLRVGILGLGVGTLAAYGKKGDIFRFYEINPQAIEIAQNRFTYLKNSPAEIELILGDGRLSIRKEVEENILDKYDVLVMDAFSDDAIPVHLLTKEAFSLYLKRINYPNGLIAVHITNTYLDLKPVIQQAAEYYNLHLSFIGAPGNGTNFRSEWALLTYNKQFLETPAIAQAISQEKINKRVGIWTDNYSNLLQILK